MRNSTILPSNIFLFILLLYNMFQLQPLFLPSSYFLHISFPPDPLLPHFPPEILTGLGITRYNKTRHILSYQGWTNQQKLQAKELWYELRGPGVDSCKLHVCLFSFCESTWLNPTLSRILWAVFSSCPWPLWVLQSSSLLLQGFRSSA